MIDKETAAGKGDGLSISEKKLNPWLSQRLAKAMLLYAGLPAMMTRQPASRLGINHLLAVPETPGIPLARDTAFPGKKRAFTLPGWSNIGLFWLTRRRRLKSPLNYRTAEALENVRNLTGPLSDAIIRSNRQNSNQIRNVPSGGEPEAKAAYNSGTIPQEPGVEPLIKSSPPQVIPDLHRIIHTPPSPNNKPVDAPGSQPHLNPGRQTPVTGYANNPAQLSMDKGPENKDRFSAAGSDSADIYGKYQASAGISDHEKTETEFRQRESASGKPEPAVFKHVPANRQSVFPTGDLNPDARPPEHPNGPPVAVNRLLKPVAGIHASEAGKAEPVPATRQPVTATGQVENVTWPSKHIHKQSKPPTRQFEPSAGKSKTTARKLKVVTGQPVFSTRQSIPVTGQPVSSTRQSIPVTGQPVSSPRQSIPGSGQSSLSSGQFVHLNQGPFSISKTSEPAAGQPEPAAVLPEPVTVHLQPGARYAEPEVKHDPSARLLAGQTVTTFQNYQTVTLPLAHNSFPGSNVPGESDDVRDGIPPEVSQEPAMLPLSSQPIKPLKVIIPAVRPLTRQPGFQTPDIPVSIPETTHSNQSNASSSEHRLRSLKTANSASPGLGREGRQIKIKVPNLKLKSNAEARNLVNLKRDIQGNSRPAAASKSNSPNISGAASLRNVSPLDLPQGQKFNSPLEMNRHENQDISLPLQNVERVTREVPVSQQSTGRNPVLFPTSPDSIVQRLDLFTPKTHQFVEGITRSVIPVPESNYQNSPADISPLVGKYETSQVFKGSQNQSIGHPQQYLPSPISRQEVPIIKTGILEIPSRVVRDNSLYPETGKPANLARMDMPLATTIQPHIYPDVAASRRSVQNTARMAPAYFQSEERPSTRRSYSPPHAELREQSEQDHADLSFNGQSAAKTDLKALAREVYPFIKRMIIVDRERLPL